MFALLPNCWSLLISATFDTHLMSPVATYLVSYNREHQCLHSYNRRPLSSKFLSLRVISVILLISGVIWSGTTFVIIPLNLNMYFPIFFGHLQLFCKIPLMTDSNSQIAWPQIAIDIIPVTVPISSWLSCFISFRQLIAYIGEMKHFQLQN